MCFLMCEPILMSLSCRYNQKVSFSITLTTDMFSELVLLRGILSFFCGQGVPLRYFSQLKIMLSGQNKTLLDRQELYEQ
jgi:hypothetical protein